MTKLLSTRAARAWVCLGGALLAANFSLAQNTSALAVPLDDITERSIVAEHRVLKHQPIREADIMWEKRLWRILDTREKMNFPFVAPESPLFALITEAALAGDLTLYSTEDDRFSKPLSMDVLRGLLYKRDTIVILDPENLYEESVQIVENELDWMDVRRYRLKESWFFDKNTGTLQVRILGIAPLIEIRNEDGDFLYEMPLFWVHYPTARPLLASKKAVMHGGNYASTLTWEDLFEMRYFASSVIKENNVQDLRLQDYLSGTDILLQSERIEDELFNREHDMWSW